MNVRKIDNNSFPFQRSKREGLMGGTNFINSNLALKKDIDSYQNSKAFNQYLLEAFNGEIVHNGKYKSSNLSLLEARNIKTI